MFENYNLKSNIHTADKMIKSSRNNIAFNVVRPARAFAKLQCRIEGIYIE
jgi:hypothetical protein